MDERVVEHGGIKWMRDDDGTILYLDEPTQKWDLWDPDDGGPMPPPELVTERRQLLSFAQLDLWRVLKTCVVVFAIAGPLLVLLNVLFAVVFGSSGSSRLFRIFQALLAATGGVLQLAIGGMVAVIAIVLYRTLEAHDLAPGDDRRDEVG